MVRNLNASGHDTSWRRHAKMPQRQDQAERFGLHRHEAWASNDSPSSIEHPGAGTKRVAGAFARHPASLPLLGFPVKLAAPIEPEDAEKRLALVPNDG